MGGKPPIWVAPQKPRLLSRRKQYLSGTGAFFIPFFPDDLKGVCAMKTEKDKNIPYKVYLTEDELPKNWYNVRADMKQKPAPLLNPGTGAPMVT